MADPTVFSELTNSLQVALGLVQRLETNARAAMVNSRMASDDATTLVKTLARAATAVHHLRGQAGEKGGA